MFFSLCRIWSRSTQLLHHEWSSDKYLTICVSHTRKRLSKRQTEFKSFSIQWRTGERMNDVDVHQMDSWKNYFAHSVLHTNHEIHMQMLLGRPHTPSREAIHSNRPCEWMCVNEFNICLAFKVVYKRFISRSIPGVWRSDSINNAREYKPQANTYEMTIKWINNSIAWVIV